MNDPHPLAWVLLIWTIGYILYWAAQFVMAVVSPKDYPPPPPRQRKPVSERIREDMERERRTRDEKSGSAHNL